MEDKTLETIREYLDKLGFDLHASKLYYALLTKGPMTVLEASRATDLERTRIYRLADDLIKEGLLEEQVAGKKRVIKAANTNAIARLIDEQEHKTAELKDSFSAFSSLIESLSPDSPSTKILYYAGRDGIRQMLWNELNASSELLAFVYKIYEEFVGPEYFERWVDEFARRGITGREIRTEIFDESYDQSQKTICFHLKNDVLKYVSSKDLPLSYSMSIYNDTVSIYNWWKGEIFGVEIHNKQVADLQRHFFNTSWNIYPEIPTTHVFTEQCLIK